MYKGTRGQRPEKTSSVFAFHDMIVKSGQKETQMPPYVQRCIGCGARLQTTAHFIILKFMCKQDWLLLEIF